MRSEEAIIESTGDKAEFRFRSLRARIVLLAIFTCLLLAGAGVSLFFFLQSSQAATLNESERHLIVVAIALKSDYAAQLRRGGTSVSAVLPTPPPPPPPIGPAGAPPKRPPPPPPHNRVDDSLAALTATVLQRELGIEGGFYSVKTGTLLGYAFPTHEGPGNHKDTPGKERPTIEDLARKAASTNVIQKLQFRGAHDAILFVAVPLQDGNKTTGSAWLMQRMPGIEAGRSKQLLVGSIGFGAAALTCGLLTFFITAEVSSGVEAVLARLGSLEGSLDGPPRNSNPKPQLAEFEEMLAGVSTLSNSLQQKIVKERALEDEIRHKQRLSALGQFAAGVAHELRNPLATIRLRTQMSQKSTDMSAIARNSVVVLDEIARLDQMIERLLYFSRPIHLEIRPIALAPLFSDALRLWSARFAAANIKASSRIPDGTIVICDASKIRQVLDNLLENAMQSLVAGRRDAPEIILSSTVETGFVSLTVSDNGPGLEPAAENHALEPFFTTKDNGTGLGLSISYEIVQAHGGDLQLKNAPERGAVATVRLPAANLETSIAISENGTEVA